jgi:hypothetical protein
MGTPNVRQLERAGLRQNGYVAGLFYLIGAALGRVCGVGVTKKGSEVGESANTFSSTPDPLDSVLRQRLCQAFPPHMDSAVSRK